MTRLLAFTTAILLCSAVIAAGPNPAVEDSITVNVVGTLRTGIVAIGGETTGTTITAKGITWELEFGKDTELRKVAEKLNGKKVTVRGTLERRAGVEVKERWIVNATELKAVGDNGVGAFPKPDFRATVGRTGTRIRFLSEGDTTVIDINSEFGIDKAMIKRQANEWPKMILVRLHLDGLESFEVVGKDVVFEWSASSTGENDARTSLVIGKREQAITKDSPYYGVVRFVDNGKKSPAKDGYFEVRLPAKLVEDNPQEITLEWIDFYRN